MDEAKLYESEKSGSKTEKEVRKHMREVAGVHEWN